MPGLRSPVCLRPVAARFAQLCGCGGHGVGFLFCPGLMRHWLAASLLSAFGSRHGLIPRPAAAGLLRRRLLRLSVSRRTRVIGVCIGPSPAAGCSAAGLLSVRAGVFRLCHIHVGRRNLRGRRSGEGSCFLLGWKDGGVCDPAFTVLAVSTAPLKPNCGGLNGAPGRCRRHRRHIARYEKAESPSHGPYQS